MAFVFLFVLVAAVVETGYVLYFYWIPWTVFILKGAGRNVFVGIHGRLNRGVVRPHPLERESTLVVVDPLVRIEGLADPDRDDITIRVPIGLEGAVADSDDFTNQAVAQLRVSWSTGDFTPFVDFVGVPGDHGKMPANLLIPKETMDPQTHQLFVSQGWEDYFGKIKYYVPAAAAIVFINSRFTEGEHLIRLYKLLARLVQEFFAPFDVSEMMRIRDDVHGPAVYRRVIFTGTRIRNQWVAFPTSQDKPYYISPYYSNPGELRQVFLRVITWLAQLELEPYGIYINEVVWDKVTIPNRLVKASQERESRRQEAAGVAGKTKAIGEGAREISATGADPTVAALIAAETAEENPGLGWIYQLINAAVRKGGS